MNRFAEKWTKFVHFLAEFTYGSGVLYLLNSLDLGENGYKDLSHLKIKLDTYGITYYYVMTFLSMKTQLSVQMALMTFRKKGGLLRAQEAISSGIHPRTLYAMRDSEQIEQTSRGLFRLAELGPLSDPDLMVVAKRVPAAVVCLISALAIHRLTTQIPHTVQIALKKGARFPRIEHPPIEVFRFSEASLSSGIEERMIDGVTVRVFSAEKTLADVFKFRHRLGMEIVLEALRKYREGKGKSFESILDYARICRVETVMRPYLEGFSIPIFKSQNTS